MLMLSWRFIAASISTSRITSFAKLLRMAELAPSNARGFVSRKHLGSTSHVLRDRGVDAELTLHHRIHIQSAHPQLCEVAQDGRTALSAACRHPTGTWACRSGQALREEGHP